MLVQPPVGGQIYGKRESILASKVPEVVVVFGGAEIIEFSGFGLVDPYLVVIDPHEFLEPGFHLVATDSFCIPVFHFSVIRTGYYEILTLVSCAYKQPDIGIRLDWDLEAESFLAYIAVPV